jgi:hypothetical protein
VPAVDAAFPVMIFGSYTGGFTDPSGLNVGSQRYFEPAYTATTLTLTSRFTNSVTYQAGGNTSPTTAATSAGSKLDAAA